MNAESSSYEHGKNGNEPSYPHIHIKGTKQLFKNRILERLTRTPIELPVSLFLLYGILLLLASVHYTSLSVWATLLMFISGLLSFSWVEYTVHRYVFHMSINTPRKKRLQYILHGVHHEYPKDEQRLAMPPLLSTAIATGLLFIFRWILGEWAFAYLSGFLMGYAFYLFIHFVVHVYSPPRNRFKAIWTNHSLHHYKNGKTAFGVTSPLWDYVYGTRNIKAKQTT